MGGAEGGFLPTTEGLGGPASAQGHLWGSGSSCGRRAVCGPGPTEEVPFRGCCSLGDPREGHNIPGSVIRWRRGALGGEDQA